MEKYAALKEKQENLLAKMAEIKAEYYSQMDIIDTLEHEVNPVDPFFIGVDTCGFTAADIDDLKEKNNALKCEFEKISTLCEKTTEEIKEHSQRILMK